MGRQSARMYFGGKDHKEVYFNGNYHKQMYLTDSVGKADLIWEKLAGEIPTYSFIVQDTTINGRTGEVVEAGRAFIYVENKGRKSYTIDWGDGTTQVIPSDYFTTQIAHNYPTSDGSLYTVTLSGDFGAFMGCVSGSGQRASGYSCIVELIDPILPQMLEKYSDGTTSMAYMFDYCVTLKKIPGNFLYKIGESNCLRFDGAFSKTAITDTPIGLFSGIRQATVGNVFMECPNLVTVNAGTYAGVDNMGGQMIFSGCTSLRYVYDSPINANWEGVFKNNGIIEIVDVDIVGCNSFKSTFDGCWNLKRISKNIFKGSPDATNFNRCFYGCQSLISGVDEHLFDNNQGTLDVESAFWYCSGITSKVPELWKRGDITNYQLCYYECVNAENYNEIPDSWKL